MSMSLCVYLTRHQLRMFVAEPLLLTFAVVTCRFMITLSATEPNLNHTTRPTPSYTKPSDLKLASTIVKQSTHRNLVASPRDLATRNASDISTVDQPQHVDMKQTGFVTRNASDISSYGQSQHVDLGQESTNIKNGSTNSVVERSHTKPSFRESNSIHTLDMISQNDSAANAIVCNVSDVTSEALQWFNSSNDVEKSGIDIAGTSTISLEQTYSNSNNWEDSETDVDKEMITDSRVYNHQTTIVTAREQTFITTDYLHRVDPALTDNPQTKTPASSPFQSGDYSELVLDVGGQILMVCELDMLCRDRCPQGTDGASLRRATTSLNVIPPDTMNPFQDTTSAYQDSVNSETLHTSSSYRYNLQAGMDTYSRQSRKLQTFLDQDYTQWESNEGINKDRENSGLGNSQETSRHCSNSTNQACFCDDLCVLNGDCCPDVFTRCFHLNTTEEILQFISDMWRQHSESTSADYPLEVSHSTMDLVLKFATCQKINTTTGMLLVSKCPDAIENTSMKDSCEKSSQMFPPVTASFQHGDLFFRNIFCARCHGVKDTEVHVWTTQYICEKNVREVSNAGLTIEDLEELVRRGLCNTSFAPPVNGCKPRQCQIYSPLSDDQKTAIKKRVQQGICSDSDAIFCQSYYYPKSGFKNIHCRTCLEGNQRRRRASDNYICDIGLYKERQKAKELSRPMSGGILLILDVTGTFRGSDRTDITYICKDQQVFDPLLLACKTLSCPAGFRPYEAKCVEVPGQYFRDGDLQIFPHEWKQLVLTIESRTTTGLPCEVSSAIVTSSNVSVRELNINTLQSLHLNIDDVVFDTSLSDCGIIVKEKDKLPETMAQIVTIMFNLLSDISDQRTILPTELERVELFNDTYQIDFSNINNSTATSYRCSGNNSLHQVQDFSFTEYNGTAYVLTSVSQREIYYPLRNVGFQVTLSRDSDKSGTWVLNQSAYVCDTWLSLRDNCSVVTYNLNETLLNGSRLMILSSGVYYDHEDFQISGDKVFVCTNFSFEYYPVRDVTQQSLAFLVLSWVLNIISIVSLFLMLVLYCLFPELCTLPGKMTASLAATMMLTFLFNLFTLVQLHHDYICPIAAVVNHVITLAHFGWMSAIAVNMALTFGPQANKLARSFSDKTIFLRYNVCVYGPSVLIVTTSVILDYTHPEPNTASETVPELPLMSNYPQYGYPYCTWFSGPMWTKLSFVLIPYLITFVISLVGFLLTLIGIQQTSKSIQKLGKKSSDKTRCLIYLKLSSAMGFSWAISAISNIYPNIVALSYIYLCLILLQGLLLFLAFMVNHRVYVLVLRKFCPKGDDSSAGRTTNSSIVMTLSA